MPQSVIVPYRNQARDLFYYNYIFGALKPFDFLRGFYATSSKDDHLTASMDAVALAYLNYQQFTPKVQTEARQHYITALRLMAKALQDPVLAKKDSTILAILLLDLYEKVTNREPHYEGAWAAHLQGALALAKMRGKEQFNNPMTVHILLRVSTNHIISCIATNRPVPEDVIALREAITSRYVSPRNSKIKESDLMVDYGRLKHKIDAGDLSGKEAVHALKELDDRFELLFTDIRPAWNFKVVQVVEKSAHHWESHHHIYPAEQIAQIWNILRITRILLNQLPLDQTAALNENKCSDQTSPPSYQLAVETVIRMISDICAAVPQYIGDPSLDNLDPSAPEHPKKRRTSSLAHASSTNRTYYLPSYRLIFPLYIASQSPAAPLQLRPWVMRQLLFMANYHGIENAAHVVDILQSGENKDPWHVYALLGSYAFVC
jgi:hypothetical protein